MSQPGGIERWDSRYEWAIEWEVKKAILKTIQNVADSTLPIDAKFITELEDAQLEGSGTLSVDFDNNKANLPNMLTFTIKIAARYLNTASDGSESEAG